MKRKYILFLLILLTIALSACINGRKTPKATSEPTPTVERTPTPTPVVTVEPTAKPTAKPLSEDQKGKPQEGAEELFREEFTDDMITEGGLTRESNPYYIIMDGAFFPNTSGAWDTYTPDIYCEVGEDYNQFEYYIDIKSDLHDTAWTSLFVGARVSEPSGDGGIPTNADAGFFVAFNKSNTAYIYPGDAGQWPGSVANVTLPEGFDTAHTVMVIDDGTKLYYYMITSANEQFLILTADLSGDNILVLDNQGNELYNKTNNLKDVKGGYFKAFNHFNPVSIDNIIIKASR